MEKLVIKFKKDLKLKKEIDFLFEEIYFVGIDCREIEIAAKNRNLIIDIRKYNIKKYDIEVRRINL